MPFSAIKRVLSLLFRSLAELFYICLYQTRLRTKYFSIIFLFLLYLLKGVIPLVNANRNQSFYAMTTKRGKWVTEKRNYFGFG